MGQQKQHGNCSTIIDLSKTEKGLIMLFSVSIVLRSVSDDEVNHSALWQENIILCSASCTEEAKNKAEIIGRGLGCEYKSATGRTIRWEYDCILSVYEIEHAILNDPDVIFARHLTSEEINNLKKNFRSYILEMKRQKCLHMNHIGRQR
jgi:hypothetical protein